jgi:pyridoxal phosphate enzyme (YggS family)
MDVNVGENYLQVSGHIRELARRCGRDPAGIRLIVVTKGHPVGTIRRVVEAGARDLGENYVEEAVEKIAALADFPDLTWHMIGHVQSRKALQVCESFQSLQSLDSLKLAERLDRFAAQLGKRLPVLLECNVSGEETKFGFPAWQEDGWPELVPAIQHIKGCANLAVCGLMTMAPFFDQAEPARQYFQRLRKLRDFLASAVPEIHWVELSMGMSGDYEVAVEEGATIVRIGTAIVGPRRPVKE